MSRMMGGIVGGLFMLIAAALLLLASEGQTCTNKWILSCAPGSDATLVVQLVGAVFLVVGPYVGYRIGARLAPHLGRSTLVGMGLGAVPGGASLAWHWWLPYATILMVVGSIVGSVIAWSVTDGRGRADARRGR